MPNAEDDMRQNREIFNSCNRQFPCCRKQTEVSRRKFLKGAGTADAGSRGDKGDHAAKLGLGTADLTKIKVIELKI